MKGILVPRNFKVLYHDPLIRAAQVREGYEHKRLDQALDVTNLGSNSTTEGPTQECEAIKRFFLATLKCIRNQTDFGVVVVEGVSCPGSHRLLPLILIAVEVEKVLLGILGKVGANRSEDFLMIVGAQSSHFFQLLS